jgi:cyclomaltodextrinase
MKEKQTMIKENLNSMDSQWADDAIFYHIYPLGLCGAPERNDISAPAVSRLDVLYPWLDHIQALGANAIYLGPVFQSTSHGYDTMDYYQVDRRLGSNQDLAEFSEALHARGMRLVLDAVFNHVGREFWAFEDVLEKGESSDYRDWFYNLRFGEWSPKGDPFHYEGWQGHYNLVKLNLASSDVRAHLFDAVTMWRETFQIDGLRLDAADCLDFDFLKALHTFTKSHMQDFWLMGEVVHGDYRHWVNPSTLDSVTNYECYKGLYSSLNDANYFEIAYSLNRQFGPDGMYRNEYLYNFVDNHDVDRVASKLDDPAHLYPLYLLLFTMPGIPSVYYGSEWGIEGVKEDYSDRLLRPALTLEEITDEIPQKDLMTAIQRLAQLRRSSEALRHGNYREVHVGAQQYAFLRQADDDAVVVALNSADEPVDVSLPLPWKRGHFADRLNAGEKYKIMDGMVQCTLSSNWGRILVYSPD